MSTTGLPQIVEEIAMIVGVENAIELCRHYEGCEVRFPSATTVDRMVRHRVIREMAQRGKPTREIATKVGLSPRQVQRVIEQKIGASA